MVGAHACNSSSTVIERELPLEDCSMILPPWIDPKTFAAAVAEFASIVGKEWVFTSEEDLNLYKDAYSPFLGEPEERQASGAVAPNSAEQVQAIVRVANKYKLPLFAFSTGRNLGYGGSAPAYSGSFIVDLKRMNKIIEINEKNAYVLVEPGVSYFDLYRYIQDKGLKLWIDCPDPGWGSLIGNALDHGVGQTLGRYRNHFDAHCGMEVVTGDGEILRTGMGAMPGSETWQQYRNGFGPIIGGIFSQSNFGIVTKMGFWLMPEPEAYSWIDVNAFRYADFHDLVDVLNYGEDLNIYSGMPDISSPILGAIPGYSIIKFNENGPTPAPRELEELRKTAKVGYSKELESYALRTRTPYWQIRIPFYGPVELIAGQKAALQRLFSRIKTIEFIDGEVLPTPLSEADAAKAHNSQIGIPSLKIFGFGVRSKWNPNPPSHGHIWFSPIIPRTGAAVFEANRVFQEAAAELNLPFATTFQVPFCFFERAFVYVLGFPISEVPEENQSMRKSFSRLVEIAAKHGWGEYRTPVAFQDQVMGTYSYNNNALLKFHEKLKDAVDPNGVLAPGRYGIWPKHLRKKQ